MDRQALADQINPVARFTPDDVDFAKMLLYPIEWTDGLIRVVADKVLTEQNFLGMTSKERKAYRYHGG
eukprot:12928177-Prorocentrum_lima.AAC.1